MSELTQRAKDLIAQGDNLFAKRGSLLSLWQTVAENFYPERADFTTTRTLGEEFASGLYSSYPIIVRRELGNSFSPMLRGRDKEWFRVTVDREDLIDQAGRQWLEFATEVMRRAMYDRVTQFVRATKEADQDYASFGQCVISQEVNWRKTALLYRCHHLRDMAWCEAEDGSIAERHLKLKPTAQWLAKTFGKDKVHQKVRDALGAKGNPYQEFNCRRIILPSEDYDYSGASRTRFPWISIYIDVDNQVVIEEKPSLTPVFVIPRWQTVSGSQYAYSPAVVAGLPDARLLQSMTLTLLEAGEMAVRPPLIAVQEAVSGGVKLFAGGITAVDAAYDERLGEVLRPLYQDKNGLPFGVELAQSKEQMLAQAFFLDKLRALPQKELTAYEASVWTKEWIRQAVPLFEPMEDEYNAALCEQTFTELMAVNAFGAAADIPQSLRRAEVQFKFESPLSQAIERQKGQQFIEAKSMVEQAMEVDPSAAAMIDFRTALRDALTGMRTPAKWIRSEQEVERHAEEIKAQQQQQAQQQQVAEGAETAQKVGDAAQALQAAA